MLPGSPISATLTTVKGVYRGVRAAILGVDTASSPAYGHAEGLPSVTPS
jgi:hypothetical protein